MHREGRHDPESWGLWIVLLGMTGLASLWMGDRDGPRRDRAVFGSSEGEFGEDDAPHEAAPPRIVFPAIEEHADENVRWDDEP